ncbi:MAG TPA: AAA family ATPase [Candidatus Dormibacteraeota bacterium]|nr:AAA family ATPase [Candidatus Dormibacteraeota bacterium]
MRLTRIQIEGFGTLRGLDIHFGEAMNLVVGPNEAGKSTLQEAILAGLYGLQSADRNRPSLVERSERWRPWQGGHFGLALELQLEDGTPLRVERDLDSETVHVTDLRSGEELSHRFERDPLGGVQVGRQLLGVTREIYTNTACISRSEVMRLEDAGSIKEAIAALADSAHPDRTAKRVLDQLREERLNRVGRPRARSGPLHDLEARLVDLERQLKGARQARLAVEELASKRESVAQLTEDELVMVQTLDAAILVSRLGEAKLRLERIEASERAVREEVARQQEHAPFASFPSERLGEVQELRSHLRATEESQRRFEAEAHTVAGQLAEMEMERNRLESEAQGLDTRARGIDDRALEAEPVIRDLMSSLAVAETQAPEAQSRAQVAGNDLTRLSERHPGLIGQNLDWPARNMEFQRVYSEWHERHKVAVEARTRAGAELPPRLEQLKHDIARYREVPDVIKAGQQAEEAMRREESLAERARNRQRTFLGAMLGGLLLTVLAILVAFFALQGGTSVYLAGAAFFLLGMGVLSTGIGIWIRAAARKEVDRSLRAKDEARVRRRDILRPWGVRSSGELQQALVEHLQKVRYDATRLELDRQASELEEGAQIAGRSLRELVGSWGLEQPAPSEDAVTNTAHQVESLAEDTIAWNAANERAQAAARSLDEVESRREGLRQDLHMRLDQLGFDRRDPMGAARDFISSCEAARSAGQMRARREQLDAQLEQLGQPGQRAAAESARADALRLQLATIYQAAGIEDPDLEAASSAWEAAAQRARAHRESSERLGELQDKGLTTAGEEAGSLRQLVQDLTAQLSELRRGVDPERIDGFSALPLAELERQRDQHRSARERAQEERARAEELLNDRLAQIGDVASLEEGISATREQLQQLEIEAHAYDLAIETLESATKSVRRAVVPRLKAQLQNQLSPITNGRYRDVRVGDDLTLQVKAHDQRTYKDVDSLSLGTRSLIYLLERVALARIIGGSAEPAPLLLDEALVHADRRRMRAALDELGRLGQDNQIILFSKDEALAERAEKAEHWTIIRLPGPAASGALDAQPSNGASREEVQAVEEEEQVPSA